MSNISIFEPRTMAGAIKIMPQVYTFFKSTFFKGEKPFATKKIDFDFKKGNRALAPFVHEKIGGKTVANTGYETKTYTAPLIAPNKITTVADLENRSMGESIYSGKKPEERVFDKLTEDFAELNEMITRREEWMCSKAMLTGKIPVIGEGLNAEIDFSFTNKETITTAAKKWNVETSDPIADLKRWHRAVQETGFVNCDICIMSNDVADVFVNHAKVKDLLDKKAYDIAVIKPRLLPNGATYVGTIHELALDIYTYNEWYLDDWTDPSNPVNQSMMPEKTLVMASTKAKYTMAYGAITLIDEKTGGFFTEEGSRIPETWAKRNPARRFLQINSRPLPIPHEVDSWYVAVVM